MTVPPLTPDEARVCMDHLSRAKIRRPGDLYGLNRLEARLAAIATGQGSWWRCTAGCSAQHFLGKVLSVTAQLCPDCGKLLEKVEEPETEHVADPRLKAPAPDDLAASALIAEGLRFLANHIETGYGILSGADLRHPGILPALPRQRALEHFNRLASEQLAKVAELRRIADAKMKHWRL